MRFLHTAVRAVLTFSIIVLIAVFFAGPSRFAVWFRTSMHRIANWLGGESDRAGWTWLGPSAFVVRTKGICASSPAAIVFATLLLWKHPTPVRIVGIGLVTLVVLTIIEYFGREPDAAPVPTLATA